MQCNAISLLRRSLEGLDIIHNTSCAMTQMFSISFPFYRVLCVSSMPSFLGGRKMRAPWNIIGSLTHPKMQTCEKCDGADPTWGGCESGTTTTQSSLSGDILVLPRFIYCKDFIPKLASYPSNLWDICFVRVICHWIKFLHKPFISYCALVYWGHPRLTCKTTGNAFLAHSVILTWGLKS